MTTHTSVWISGTSGYIGRHVAERLRRAGLDVVAIARASAHSFEKSRAPLPAAAEDTPSQCAEGSGVLLHLAGPADRTTLSPSASAEAIAFADRVISQANACGVRRAILASSIYARLSGDGSDPYGRHKLEVERIFGERFDGELVVLRLPPVYGGDERKSGIAKLWRLVSRGIPLPLAGACAPRDYIAIDNLAELIERFVEAPIDPTSPRVRIFEPSDGKPICTRELVEQMARLQGVRLRLWHLPRVLLNWLDAFAGVGGSIVGPFRPLLTEGNEPLRIASGWTPAVRPPASLLYLCEPS